MMNDQNILGIEVKNWKKRPRPAAISMHGNYCTLEPFNVEKHDASLFSALQIENNGESWAYLPYGPCSTLNEFKTCMEKICTDKDTLLYTILDSKTQMPVGVCGYLRINPEHGVIEVGHLHYSKLLQKTAAATEAMYLLLRYAFDDLGYRRYEWKCNALNTPSRKSAERLGFTFEGIFRQCNVFKGHNRDTVWLSIIDSEWPGIKAKLAKWLVPNNFDNVGKQLKSL